MTPTVDSAAVAAECAITQRRCVPGVSVWTYGPVVESMLKKAARRADSTQADERDIGTAPNTRRTDVPPTTFGCVGAHERTPELASGVIGMAARACVPQLGRFLQVDPVFGGSANTYDYANREPVSEADLGGTGSSIVGVTQSC